MAIKGNLSDTGLAEVCQLLALGLKTGCLSVVDRARFGQLYFERGRVLFATIVNRRDRLGRILVREGLVTRDALESALSAQAESPGTRLGELLVAGGAVSRESLDRCIRVQMEEAVYHLFGWSRGTFFFEADARPPEGELTVSLGAEGLLLEAARRHDEWSLVATLVPSPDAVFAPVDGAATPEGEDVGRIRALVGGRRSVADLAAAAGIGELEAARAVSRLVAAGAARLIAGAADRRSSVEEEADDRLRLGLALYRSGMFSEAEAELERVLDVRRNDATARLHLALIALRHGRPAAAADALRVLAAEPSCGAPVRLALAAALRALGRPDDALEVLDEADSQSPASPGVPLGRAAAHLQARRPSAARRELAEHLNRLGGSRRSAAYWYHAALAAALASESDAAGALADEGLRAWPDSAPLLLLGGLLCERRGDLDAAERMYRRAVETDAAIAQAHKGLGDITYRRGSPHEALRHYARAAELAPELGDDLFEKMGNLHYRARAPQEASRCWHRALELNPSNQAARTNLEMLSRAVGV